MGTEAKAPDTTNYAWYARGMLNYEGPMYRPPSEADSLIIQATLGCSWNHCTYCAMYRHKQYRVRPLEDVTAEIQALAAAQSAGSLRDVRRVFIADGDALAMPTEHWLLLLEALNHAFPKLTRISCYATARNLLEKTEGELAQLNQHGLKLLYIGPESGDNPTLKAIAKGASFEQHVEAARRATVANLQQSLIFLLGAAGTKRSEAHARGAGRLTSAMNPRFVSLLTITVVPDTPLMQLKQRGRFEIPEVKALLKEIHWFLQEANPSNTVFRSNHASNYLPLSGRLPRDRERLLKEVSAAMRGDVALTPEWARGL